MNDALCRSASFPLAAGVRPDRHADDMAQGIDTQIDQLIHRESVEFGNGTARIAPCNIVAINIHLDTSSLFANTLVNTMEYARLRQNPVSRLAEEIA
jgi:hypothetical protein